MLAKENYLHIIKIDYALSPKTFYGRYLKDLQRFFRELNINPGKRLLCIDLLNCEAIEGNVIPNLFVTGYIIKSHIGEAARLYLQPGANVSAFLQGINFYNINREQQIFEIIPDTSEEKERYRLADYCTTSVFKETLTEEQVAIEFVKKYSKLFQNHLEDFVYLKRDSEENRMIPINIMEVLCKQICCNSIEHGISPSYVTMQVNHANEVVLISFADYGKGMYLSIKEKVVKKDYHAISISRESLQRIKNSQTKLDILAILESVVYRYNSKYGIWFVLQDVMRLRGIVRIHTGKARVSFAGIDVMMLEKCTSKESAFKALYIYLKSNPDNIQETPNYMGTHIEIEIPLINRR